MPVIAVVNRKGGSGKSTLSAHIAAWCARQGHSVMLGDVDRQQSSRAWLKRRAPTLPAIAPWALDQKNVLRVPTGITHVVLDTPGGIHGFELARVVMFADAIIMPVCHSVFDRESAAACHAELMALPRVASGRCRLATVGMRIGIHGGAMVGCTIGSASRIEYTVVGDAVNVAARLQALNVASPTDAASSGCRILVSASVHSRLPASTRVEFLGNHGVKGRRDPVAVYRVVDDCA